MAVELAVVEIEIGRVSEAIKSQRGEHVKLTEAQGRYDLAQQETQDSLKKLRDVLSQVD